MSKSNVSDIDYSVFNTTNSSETPSEAPKLKSEGISKRSIVKAKAEEKPRDLTNASNPAQIAQRATDTANALPNVEVPDTLANYALPVLGAIGTGLAAYGLWKNQNKLPLGETVAGAPPEGMTQKTDLRNVQPVAETPAAPQPEFPQATTQQSVLPQGYGQQTINAPTGAPVVPTAAPQPVAPAATAPVDPIQAAKIREAEAKAAIAEHKLQQLQAGPKTAPAAKAGKAPVSEEELQMIQKSGAAGTAKELQAMEAASKISPTPDPVQATATPVEKQAAVDVVKQQEQKQFEDMKPTYNKTKKNIGPGAYNWLAGQEGPKAPEVWQNIVGDKNVSYSEFMEKNKPVYEAYLGSYGEPDPFKQVAKPGEYRAPSMIPKSIKGSVAPGALAATAALATVPALAAAGYHSYKGNKEAVDAELKDAWHSLKSAFTWPVDVAKAAGKGDFGPLKDALMSMNPGTLLLNEANKQDQQAIQRMIQAEKVGSGRGIAPPSSYQR